VYEKSLEMKHFRVCPYPGEAELAPSWAAGVGRDEKKRAPTEAVGCTIDAGEDGKSEILAYVAAGGGSPPSKSLPMREVDR